MNPTSLIEQIRAGTAPPNIKQFAAQGLLPVPEDELISVQIFLCKDQDSAIASTAFQSLQKITEGTWSRLIENRTPDLAIIQFCLEQNSFPASLREKIILNHSVPDETIRRVAAVQSGMLLDLIINNQVRLLRSPEIITALERNPFLNFDQKRRLEEFKIEFVFKKKKLEREEAVPIEQTPVDDILAQIPNLDMEAVRILQEADQEQHEELTQEQIEQSMRNLLATDDLTQISEDTLSIYQRILKLKQGEKIRLALLGTKEERSILIRDSSRQVASMVLRSPKLTEGEIEFYAQMRNLDSELLRQMGHSRDFLKKYSVVHCLVKNPKTPSPVSLNLLKLLREIDLRNLARDRNIPDVIRRQARHIYEQKAHR